MADERRDYAVLISLMMREEAEVAAAALRADGIDAFIGNTNHSYFNWFHVLALGGLQVMVPRGKQAEAKRLRRERISENAGVELDEPVQRRDRWKAWLIGAWLYGPITVAWVEYLFIPPQVHIEMPDMTWRIREWVY
jgi:hypothetical protein